MKITKSQKIWLSLLGVAVVGLGANELMGTSSTVANTMAEVGPIIAAATVTADAPASPVVSVKSDKSLAAFDGRVAGGLRSIPGCAGSSRDVFTPSTAWIAPKPVAPVDLPAVRATAFQHAHTLKAILCSGSAGNVMIDSRLIAVGQTLDGFKLVSVTASRATFAQGDSKVSLMLPSAELSGETNQNSSVK